MLQIPLCWAFFRRTADLMLTYIQPIDDYSIKLYYKFPQYELLSNVNFVNDIFPHHHTKSVLSYIEQSIHGKAWAFSHQIDIIPVLVSHDIMLNFWSSLKVLIYINFNLLLKQIQSSKCMWHCVQVFIFKIHYLDYIFLLTVLVYS